MRKPVDQRPNLFSDRHDAGINEELADKLAAQHTFAMALKRRDQPSQISYSRCRLSRQSSDPERLVNRHCYFMCRACDMDALAFDDTA
jgi:hypothetical protein